MKCRNCPDSIMLVMTNTTRPHTDDNSLTVRYLCTDCGAWGTAMYKLDMMLWDENEAILDIDEHRDEELYFVGRHVKSNENK